MQKQIAMTASLLIGLSMPGCADQPTPSGGSSTTSRKESSDLNTLKSPMPDPEETVRILMAKDRDEARTLRDRSAEFAKSGSKNSADAAQLESLNTAYLRNQLDRCGRALELVKQNPEMKSALDTLVWIATNDPANQSKVGIAALELLSAKYSSERSIVKVLYAGLYHPSFPTHDAALVLLNKVAKDPSAAMRAQAFLCLAQHDQSLFNIAEHENAKDTDQRAEKALKAYEILLRPEYVNQPVLLDGVDMTLGRIAAQQISELRDLRVGKPAPDFEATDLQGQPINLSAYRGKYVVMKFWATWCVPCMAGLPKDRQFVDELKDHPVAFIGINGDTDLQEARKVDTRGLTKWRSAWNGRGGMEGPITSKFNVGAWPDYFLIDPQGNLVSKHSSLELIQDALKKALKIK